MKLAIYMFVFSCSLQSVLIAQTRNKIYLNNIAQVGFITANKPSSINLETINGIKYKTWSAGIGLGIDWQNERSIPLFLDVRKYFDVKKSSWFIYADGGKNMWWQKNNNTNFFTSITPYQHTYFGEAGIGYSFRLRKKKHYFLSIGYGNKNIQYNANYTYIYTQLPTDYYAYRMNTYINRLVFKIGIQF